jgi:dihydroorotase
VLGQDTEVNFEDSVPGALSLEIALPAIWKDLCARVGEARAIELLSLAPAKLVGAKSAFDENTQKMSNIVILDPNKPHEVSKKDFAGHVSNSPLLDKTLPSSILATFVSGVWTKL